MSKTLDEMIADVNHNINARCEEAIKKALTDMYSIEWVRALETALKQNIALREALTIIAADDTKSLFVERLARIAKAALAEQEISDGKP